MIILVVIAVIEIENKRKGVRRIGDRNNFNFNLLIFTVTIIFSCFLNLIMFIASHVKFGVKKVT